MCSMPNASGCFADDAQLSAEIDGFKMYIKTAEKHRLNMLTSPERTPELFEKPLPYFIALDVVNDWCKKNRRRIETLQLSTRIVQRRRRYIHYSTTLNS